jgi:hypothetical protein
MYNLFKKIIKNENDYNCLIIEKEHQVETMQTDLKNIKLDLNAATNELNRLEIENKKQLSLIVELQVGLKKTLSFQIKFELKLIQRISIKKMKMIIYLP